MMKSQTSHQKKFHIKGTIKRNHTTGLFNKSIAKGPPKSVPKPIDLPSHHREKEKSYSERNVINKSSSWSNYASETSSILKQESQSQLSNQGLITKSQWNTEKANQITPKENSSVFSREEDTKIELNGSDFPTLEKSVQVTKSSTINSSSSSSNKTDIKHLLNNQYHWADEDEDVEVGVSNENEKKVNVVEESVTINNSESNVKYNMSKRDIHFREKRTTSYSDSRRKSSFFESRKQYQSQHQQQNFPSVTNRPRILTSNNNQIESSESKISIEEYERRIKETMRQKALEKRREIEEKLRREEEERMARARAKLEELDRRKEQERLEKERQEKERLEKERQEQERLEKERLEKEREEKERLEKERQEKERQEKERLEKERLEREKAEQERKEKERLEKERQQKEQEKKTEVSASQSKPSFSNDKRDRIQPNGYSTYKRGDKKAWDNKNIQKQQRNDSWNRNNQYNRKGDTKDITKFRGGKYDSSLKYNRQQYNKYNNNYYNVRDSKTGNKPAPKTRYQQKEVVYKKNEVNKTEPKTEEKSADVREKTETKVEKINKSGLSETKKAKPSNEVKDNKNRHIYKNSYNNQPNKLNNKKQQQPSSKQKKMVYVKVTDLQ